MRTKLRRRLAARFWLWLVWVALAIGLLFLTGTGQANASQPVQSINPGNDCVICHATPGLGMQFPSGEIVSVTVDPLQWQQSVHGTTLQCTACHTDLQTYPHFGNEVIHPSPRDITYLTRTYTQCGECHIQEYQQYLGSSHAQALSAGKTDSAICSDCHGEHNIMAANTKENGLDLQAAVIRCGGCHQEQFEQYQSSVHGKALLENGDPNVPACIDCHGVHNMGVPTVAGFRRKSPSMCASCHADEQLMKQYGKSTEILNTYVADFHGTTSRLYAADSGKAPEQAVCYDCHGVHDIRSMADADNPAVTGSVVEMCQKCHTDATTNFPAAWLGHPRAHRSAVPAGVLDPADLYHCHRRNGGRICWLYPVGCAASDS